jgi:hypothetical protein
LATRSLSRVNLVSILLEPPWSPLYLERLGGYRDGPLPLKLRHPGGRYGVLLSEATICADLRMSSAAVYTPGRDPYVLYPFPFHWQSPRARLGPSGQPSQILA